MTTSVDRAAVANRVLPLVDLTSLGDDDRPEDIERLCSLAVTPYGSVASVCVWPRFVAQSVELLQDTGVAVCAVANFPAGADDAVLAIADARAIVEAGGVEVDVVVPWRALAAGATGAIERLVSSVREVLDSPIILKAILETGELQDPEPIASAGREALAGGADFLKTSTGKTERSATPEAVEVLLSLLADHAGGTPRAGLKVSGGVSTVEQAAGYLDLADRAFGADRVDPKTVRFGASRLLEDITAALSA